MKVVSDASPLCYAIWIGEEAVLPALFGRIIIPTAVAEELAHEAAPPVVRSWMAAPPDWLDVRSVAVDSALSSTMARLHRGEQEALALARQLEAELVLIDERAARRTAEALGLRVMGLLGILDEAARKGWLDFSATLDRLVETSFYLSPQLLESLRRLHES